MRNPSKSINRSTASHRWILALLAILTYACTDTDRQSAGTVETGITEERNIFQAETSKTLLPEDIQWLTNDTERIYASPAAKKGGTLRLAIRSFPLTFRTVGPDSNAEFRGAILGNNLSLIGLHPNTMNIIPELATHWAYGKDKKSMYFKLNEKARGSDGGAVTAHEFAYTLEFMRSKYIVAPWYNDY